ncbi:saccharopine dehydrogenase NADP-binding domain-containing protein [Aestuariirhabdus sp. Z084]|uniref:saccharopine dehydrogenase family protein n=1 Tax=Aestuariirhabdus haliotis TaxID=2918751 RepID=UPI00201B3AB6|nr:saccharopine dehydrogenase NADP-binding domain-containing protein [Aestuariirhabdus haliotis]MCL6417748.1 saccharopine dehydrogenase NADP-binding domain-containing protein [Aestuariirhabdus haliotis]MCL6421687.1 saccharopine dehydrogenase NADP-binding domain-containing protein [Aestuariirhabdus haliotis]
MSSDRELGIIVYGATGYTGRLVCEYLNKQYGVNGDVKWAMAGRSEEKLISVRDEMGIPEGVPLVVADSSDLASIQSMAERTQVLLTTVGPYQLYGSDVVGACVKAGTDYVDLCGEPAWMHEMIGTYGEAAKASGARIVFSCGFDSVPFDLGVYFLQQNAKAKLGSSVSRIKGRVRAMKGTFSGGTLASFRATMAAAAKKPELLEVLMNPFALTEGKAGPEQPSGMAPVYDDDLGSWSAPFVMATINTKNIHRSNLLLGHEYGEGFVYDEMMLTGPGDKGEAMAKAVAEDKSMANDPRKPGEGPTKEERETGFYDVLFAGSNDKGESMSVSVQGDKDPGYGSTSKMIAESTVCLLKNLDAAEGGIWTPASAMGSLLIDRLQANAGLTFKVEA